MAKLFGNLHLVLAIGLVAALALMFGVNDPSVTVSGSTIGRWLHLFFAVL